MLVYIYIFFFLSVLSNCQYNMELVWTMHKKCTSASSEFFSAQTKSGVTVS